MKIANRQARILVRKTEPFKGNNLFGHWKNPRFYIVYSYGLHWPLWVYDAITCEWFGNKDKYSVTTSKHFTQSHPNVSGIKFFSIEDLRLLII